jgi:hypothetical protein
MFLATIWLTRGGHMGTIKGVLAAVSIGLILFGVVWLVVPGLPARERRGVGISGLLVGVALLAMADLL